MKRHNIMEVMIIIISLVLFSSQGWATPILLPDPGQPSNAGDGTIQTWLIASINLYNTTHDPDLSMDSVGAHPDIKVVVGDSTAPPGYPTFPADTLSITLPGNLNDYLVLHWGGEGGGVYQAFDLTSIPEEWDTFTAPGRNGLSFYSFYGGESSAKVPEPATMLLLGSGLIGLAGYGRKKLFKK